LRVISGENAFIRVLVDFSEPLGIDDDDDNDNGRVNRPPGGESETKEPAEKSINTTKSGSWRTDFFVLEKKHR
jgi:hypothetical protein